MSHNCSGRRHKATRRQGIGVLSPLQQLVSPLVATVVPAAGAAGIAIYGRYGNDLRRLYNSIFGTYVVNNASAM